MLSPDQQANAVIDNLSRSFHKQKSIKPPLLLDKHTVGCEIEVKFRYYFPEIFKEYFENKKWFEYNEDERKHITKLITEAEKDILPDLEKTLASGLHKGYDRFWEFIFQHSNDLTLQYQQIDLLQKAKLIPFDGNHSLHITIGNIDLNKQSYYILMILQLLFLDKERIIEGFDNKKNINATWAKKGQAGILPKNSYDLTNCDKGIELRTLSINKHTDVYYMFKVLHFLLSNLENSKNNAIFEPVIQKMEDMGLPNKNWSNPYANRDIWNKYIEKFDELSMYTKKLVLENLK